VSNLPSNLPTIHPNGPKSIQTPQTAIQWMFGRMLGTLDGCLGSLDGCFNIFLSDLASSFTDPNVTLKFFADDCKAYIIYDEKDLHEKKSSIVAFIRHFETWCANNGQELSDKCSALYLGHNNPREVYSVSNSQIQAVTTVIRDLGLLITPDLKWKTHIQSKINSTLNLRSLD
jgi:hypothetical protein